MCRVAVYEQSPLFAAAADVAVVVILLFYFQPKPVGNKNHFFAKVRS